MNNFKDYFMDLKEFQGTLENKKYKIKIRDTVRFKYKEKTYTGIVTEIEDGEHGKAIVSVEGFKNPLLIHVSKLASRTGKNTKIKELKDYDIVYK